MVATSFLSGLFGMAGGMILIGCLLFILPVPSAMVLHAVTQIASNGWRALLWRRHVRWAPVAAYVAGNGVAFAAWSLMRYVPSLPVAFLFLGLTPFMVRLMPARFKPNPESPAQGIVYGAICMTLMLLTGVAGPLIDTLFLGGGLDRREIVATKAMCQIIGHAVKLSYFGAIVAQAAAIDPFLACAAILASLLGTTLAKQYLERMTDVQYRVWAARLITAIAGYYVVHGTSLLLIAP
jgi:uncharacterized membrane protein YfcA